MNCGKSNSAVVIGAGIAGIKAALDLAEQGHRVFLCDRKPYAGGALIQLDKWFPDGHCGMCKVLPVFSRDDSSQYCLRRGLVHPNIEIIPGCELEALEGQAGDFTARVRVRPTGVRPDRCIGCGKCAEVCPVEVGLEFNEGLSRRKAIFLGNPLAADKTYVIDRENCTACGACADACPVGAVDLSMSEEQRELSAGAVVLSSGFDEFDALAASAYGYRRFPNVITSIELERTLSGSGPTQGRLIRPSDGAAPRSVAFFQCVGSRSLNHNYCSSACCMIALKEAMMIREACPDTEVCIYFMDLRAFGKGYYRYFEKARDELGIRFVRCRVPRVMQNFKTNNLNFNALDEQGRPLKAVYELVVLSVGQTPSARFRRTAAALGLETNAWGFCRTRPFSPVETERPGVLACGSASAPKDIAETLAEASAAAAQASLVLEPAAAQAVEMPLAAGSGEFRAAVFICNCGGEISKAVDLPALVQYCRKLDGVVCAGEISPLCREEGLQALQSRMRDSKATHVVAAGCAALRAQKALREIPSELVDIREGLAWVHAASGPAAARKAETLVAMAHAKLRLAGGPAAAAAVGVTGRALVIGGGAAGLSAALAIARRGHEVDLVEKSETLGGQLCHLAGTLEGEDPRAFLQELVAGVRSESRVRVRLKTEVDELSGHAGAFHAVLRGPEPEAQRIEAGAVIIATGAEAFVADEHLYGRCDRVLTQRELESRLGDGSLDPAGLKSVVMIQCVGSMDRSRPYCSRVCCSQALKNALQLKQRNPAVEVTVLYRELMSYGFTEEYYTAARERGVLFARFEADAPPEVIEADGILKVIVTDAVLGGRLEMHPERVVLSTGIVAGDNRRLAGMMDLPLNADGFFQEAEAKFRPVDLLRDGIFVCGLAHSPRRLAETITQAQAAAGRAGLILSRSRLESGAMVSQINPSWCSGCELCIRACPFGARTKDPDEGVAVVVETLCQACGACVTICPNKASKLKGYTDKQFLAVLDEVV